MSHASMPLRRSVMAVIVALGLALTAVGGTMAQEERDTTTAVVTIKVPTPNGTITRTIPIEVDPTALEPEHSGQTNDLRGKILRITPLDEP